MTVSKPEMIETRRRHQRGCSAVARSGEDRDTWRGQGHPRTSWPDMACKRSPGHDQAAKLTTIADHNGTGRDQIDSGMASTGCPAHGRLPTAGAYFTRGGSASSLDHLRVCPDAAHAFSLSSFACRVAFAAAGLRTR